MPQKPKKKPPPSASSYENITFANAETQMSQFVKYYKGIGLVGEEEWKHFLQSLFNELPLSFRISARTRRCNNIYDGRPGVLSEAEVLREYLKNEIITKLSGVEVDGEPFQIKSIPWYPNQMGWKASTDFKMLSQSSELKPIAEFLFSEEKGLTLFNQDLTSMIPPLLVDVLPQHKVLELHCGVGHQTAQIMELLYANPKKMPDGFLVANDKDRSRTQYRINQGTNILYTHHPAETFPDLYLTPEHDQDSKVLYDRIFLDGASSNDGSLRSNPKLRIGWSITNAQKNHTELKKQVRRALELLEINGQLVYSTQSMNPLENEAVVAAIMSEAPGALKLVDVKNKLPSFHIRQGMTQWKVMSQGLVFYDKFDDAPAWYQKENERSLFPPDNIGALNIEKCLRVLPHDNDTGAFFVAVFMKMGDLPWVKEEAEEAKVKMETDEAGGMADGDAKKEEDKPKYLTPLRCDVNVSVTEIEWTTEITDEQLNTRTDTEVSNFGLPEINISKCCIPLSLQRKMKAERSGYKEITEDNPDWAKIKDRFDIKKFDPVPYMLQYDEDGQTNAMYYFCSPDIKKLILYNKDAVMSRKSAGGLTFMKGCLNTCQDLYPGAVLPLMPYINKRLLSVPKSDLVLMLENKEVLFDKFSDKVKATLEGMKDETGYMYFYYEPKGKNADPRCTIIIKREKFDSFVKKTFSPYSNDDKHNLRLCGITSDEEEGQENMQVDGVAE
ncbi:RNA cytosine-C(5)-methyltransferase NSUN2-like [Mya arenaria]|uniref:RNA cytosine-C(5)-methyltransferase NSUN2-like n=1 Tax=Mya arenaria TaxID=6604 RepID=UPI0022E48A46|nr:RNA cytosine-C(5)-methyltransferase NSUN2-like [Mya arenaria]